MTVTHENKPAPERCGVCYRGPLTMLKVIKDVPYWRCQHCKATLMAPQCWLDEAGEKAIYDLHENNPDDDGYRRFLGKLADPLRERLVAGARGQVGS